MDLGPYIALNKNMIRLWRFMYWPPWATTNWGFLSDQTLRPQRGGDEYHNDSWFMVIPLLGVFTVFTGKFSYDNGPHVHSHGPDGYSGYIDLDCEGCQEFIKWVEQVELDVD